MKLPNYLYGAFLISVYVVFHHIGLGWAANVGLVASILNYLLDWSIEISWSLKKIAIYTENISLALSKMVCIEEMKLNRKNKE